MKIKHGELRGKDKWVNLIEYVLNMKHQNLKGKIKWRCSCGHETEMFVDPPRATLTEDLLECKKCKLQDSIMVK